MNTFRLVQTAAQAIAEAISEGIASSTLSAEGAAVTYSATAEEGRWAITITDLHPRGGRLSEGMLAGIAKQIATAAERKAGAPSAQPAAPTPTPAEEDPAQTEEPTPTATAQTIAEPTPTLSAQAEPADAEGPTITATAEDPMQTEGDPYGVREARIAWLRYFADKEPPEGYTITEYQTPIEGGIGHYLLGRIRSAEERSYLMNSEARKCYCIRTRPDLYVDETDAGHGLRRIKAEIWFGPYGQNPLFIDMAERDGAPTGIARCWQVTPYCPYGIDWYENGLLIRSQRWPRISPEEYAASAWNRRKIELQLLTIVE